MVHKGKQFTKVLMSSYMTAITLICVMVVIFLLYIGNLVIQQSRDTSLILQVTTLTDEAQSVKQQINNFLMPAEKTERKVMQDALKKAVQTMTISQEALLAEKQVLLFPQTKQVLDAKLKLTGSCQFFSDMASWFVLSGDSGLTSPQALDAWRNAMNAGDIYIDELNLLLAQMKVSTKKTESRFLYALLALMLSGIISFFFLGKLVIKPADRQLNRLLNQLEERRGEMMSVFNKIPSALVLLDRIGGYIIDVNESAEKLLGMSKQWIYQGDGVLFSKYCKVDVPIDQSKTGHGNSGFLGNQGISLPEDQAVEILTGPNKGRFVHLTMSIFQYNKEPVILVSLSDITQMKLENDLLQLEADTDSMTGLLNKRAGIRRLKQQLLNDSKDVAVVFIDVDGLKDINDRYGHDVGDQYILSVTKMLRRFLRSQDIAFRYGGDELVLFFTDCDIEQIHHILQRVQMNLAMEADIPYTMSISYGVAETSELNRDADELMLLADQRMYENKRVKKESL